MKSLRIRTLAAVADDIAIGQALVREYVLATAEEIGQDLDTILPFIPDYHDFASVFLPPAGTYAIAESGGVAGDVAGYVAGGAGIRRIDQSTCEMNRLWVLPHHRGKRIAHALCEHLLIEARDAEYQRMILDVVPSRVGAIALYESLGFTETEPVHEYPFAMRYFAKDL